MSLTQQEEKFFRSLSTPQKIQDFLDSIPFNFEENGETCFSPKMVLRERKANCIEGGMLAAYALSLQGERPYILNLKVESPDDDHVVALFKQNGLWGAISKTNHAVLRYRDPVYRTVRELAMSYFHEYFLAESGKKTMVGFSRPISMNRFGVNWVTREDGLWDIAEYMYDAPVQEVVPKKEREKLRAASKLEREAARIPQWKRT